MIPGIVASQEDSAAGASTDTATLDFVAGNYSFNETTLTAAEVIDDTGRIDGNGLSIISANPVNFLGDVATLLLSGNWTVVIEYTAASGAPSLRLWLLTCLHDFFSDVIQLYTVNRFATFFDLAVASTSRLMEDGVNQGSVGVNKIAWTRSDAAAMSINGNAVISDVTNVTGIVINQAQCADANGAAGASYIRSITILPVQANSALPALST